MIPERFERSTHPDEIGIAYPTELLLGNGVRIAHIIKKPKLIAPVLLFSSM